MHFLNSLLNYFTNNCGYYSEEQGERFNDLATMEERYQGFIGMLICYQTIAGV